MLGVWYFACIGEGMIVFGTIILFPLHIIKVSSTMHVSAPDLVNSMFAAPTRIQPWPRELHTFVRMGIVLALVSQDPDLVLHL